MKIKWLIFIFFSTFLCAEYFYDNTIVPWNVRREMERVLHKTPQNAPQKLATLLEQTTDIFVKNRIAATKAISELGIVNDKVINALIIRLENNPSEGVKKWTALAFGNLGIKTPRTTEHLKKLAKDPSHHVRHAAAMALAELQEQEVILGLMKSHDPTDREVAARSFVYMGRKAQKFLTHIAKLSRDENVHVQREAMWALNNISQYTNICDKIKTTIEKAQSVQRKEREAAFEKLFLLGSGAIPVILELASHQNKQVRQKAIDIIAQVQQKQQKIIWEEQQRLQDYIKSQLGNYKLTTTFVGEKQLKTGNAYKYKLVIENQGPDVAHDVLVRINLPNNLYFRGRTSTETRWEIGSLAAKTPRTYSFTVVPVLPGKQKISISTNSATNNKKHYTHPIVVSKAPQQNRKDFAMEIIGERSMQMHDTATYRIAVKNLRSETKKNLQLHIILPFHCREGKKRNGSYTEYEILELQAEQIYQKTIHLTGNFPGEGALKVVLIDEKYVQQQTKAVEVIGQTLYKEVLAAQNPMGIDIKFAINKTKYVVNENFRCSVSLHNKTDKTIENFDLNVTFPKNINPNNRGAGPRIFLWPDISLAPNSTKNVYVDCEMLEEGEAAFKVFLEKNNKEVFHFFKKIMIEK
ncbi:HEAT repeat domain-containing protein [Candidatus Uabimicrobium amorphum]|uniref:DUF11 domain-containing protein n=1 Tax=Uabimicrobium amorphum TaxID=2596890 RepID=A0A5S9F302_UABAM|nr:HEAT repeat domain-containing protein [Candidatus Uabimicrobium amorphum]BBM83019.1 hypothetical protein UABAM_01362 [Candidatus Uabimicrobium amorphum]